MLEQLSFALDRAQTCTTADAERTKPRLVFFKYQWAPELPPFLLTHTREHVRCLSQFFQVLVVDEDCDYQQVCDTYEPDLALFESGINISTCRRIDIANVQRYPNVPKLGFFNADGWCETRAGILSEMDHWRIDTFFSIAVTAGEHTPAIADNLFVWPGGIDPAVYRDYGQVKLIPMLLTGAASNLYPWRQRVFEKVSKQYPSLVCPHHGYTSRAGTAKVLHGEEYARVINASIFAPACGTVAKELVRKHLEIPACGTCLITERSPGLELAGFVDMKNCVFADEHDVLDKVGYLLDNPAELARITRAGHDLVHTRHTAAQRDQVLQWLRLKQRLQPGERIVQTNPFEPLTIVSEGSAVETSHIISNGLHLSLVQDGNRLLWSGDSEGAEACYARSLEYMRRLPEAKFGLAAAKLNQGKPEAAHQLLTELLEYTLGQYHAPDPDPVEWSYYVLTSLCEGDVKEAVKRANQFSRLDHPELRRVRWAAAVLSKGPVTTFPIEDTVVNRVSVHQIAAFKATEWIERLANMLRACGQNGLADSLARAFQQAGAAPVVEAPSTPAKSRMGWLKHNQDGAAQFRRQFFYSKVRRRIGRILKALPLRGRAQD
jgi:hypothetical protein